MFLRWGMSNQHRYNPYIYIYISDNALLHFSVYLNVISYPWHNLNADLTNLYKWTRLQMAPPLLTWWKQFASKLKHSVIKCTVTNLLSIRSLGIIWLNFEVFLSRKSIWKYYQQDGGNSVQASICYGDLCTYPPYAYLNDNRTSMTSITELRSIFVMATKQTYSG